VVIVSFKLNPTTGKFDLVKPDNFSFKTIADGRFVKIPANQQMIVNGDLVNEGTLNIEGELSLVDIKNKEDYLVFVSVLGDFPAPVSGVISLPDNSSWFLTTSIDLSGNRIACGENVTIIGASSESCYLSSTGLTDALISSNTSLTLRHFSITATLALDLNADGHTLQALDWYGVNFLNCTSCGTIQNYANFIGFGMAFLNSSGITFGGTIGTVAFNQSFFSANSGQTAIAFSETAVIERRIRITNSSFVIATGGTGINAPLAITIPDESYILDTVNFSGAGTYTTGIEDTSNKSLFVACVGIQNTRVSGQLYAANNALGTVVSATDTFYKANIATTASDSNKKYDHENNRLTNRATIERRYLVQCTLSFTAGNNNVCTFGLFDSKLGSVRLPSRTKATANSAGRAENVSLICVVEHSDGQFIELHCANNTSTTNIVVTDMNMVITEI
jgi:hypothetical protein